MLLIILSSFRLLVLVHMFTYVLFGDLSSYVCYIVCANRTRVIMKLAESLKVILGPDTAMECTAKSTQIGHSVQDMLDSLTLAP